MVLCVTCPGIGASALTLDTPYEYWIAKFVIVYMCKLAFDSTSPKRQRVNLFHSPYAFTS